MLLSLYPWKNLGFSGWLVWNSTKAVEKWEGQQISGLLTFLWNQSWYFLTQSLQTKGEHVSFLLGKEGTGLAVVWVVLAPEALIRGLTQLERAGFLFMYRIIKGARHSNKRPRKPLPKILSTTVMDQGVWPEGKAHFRKGACFSRHWHSCYSGYDYSSKEVTGVDLNFNWFSRSGKLFVVGVFCF